MLVKKMPHRSIKMSKIELGAGSKKYCSYLTKRKSTKIKNRSVFYYFK